MKVVFLPDYCDGPYQQILKKELSCLGVSFVPASRSRFFPLLKTFFSQGPEIIHLHWSNPYLLGRNSLVSLVKSFLFIFELYFCKISGLKIIWTIHNLYNHEKYQYQLERFFNRIIARQADAIIVHSVFHKKEVMNFYGLKDDLKIFTVYEGNYSDFYKNEISGLKAREKLGLSAEDRIFLFFGNIRKYKGVLELVKAFRRTSSSSLKLVIAGKPYGYELKKELENAVKNEPRIKTFLDFVPEDEVQIYMNSADAVVLPYIEITNSTVLFLAMTFGKAVFYSKNGYMLEILGEGGIPFDIKAPGQLPELLDKTSPSLFKVMGEKNLRKISGFTWKKNAFEALKIYESLNS